MVLQGSTEYAYFSYPQVLCLVSSNGRLYFFMPTNISLQVARGKLFSQLITVHSGYIVPIIVNLYIHHFVLKSLHLGNNKDGHILSSWLDRKASVDPKLF